MTLFLVSVNRNASMDSISWSCWRISQSLRKTSWMMSRAMLSSLQRLAASRKSGCSYDWKMSLKSRRSDVSSILFRSEERRVGKEERVVGKQDDEHTTEVNGYTQGE